MENENENAINETHEEDNEVENRPVKKTRKPFVWTEARKEAFARCREAREQKDKTIRATQKQTRIQKGVDKLKLKVKELESVDETLPVKEQVKKVALNKKPKIQIVDESENDSDSDSEEEYVVSRVKKSRGRPAPEPEPEPEYHHQSYQPQPRQFSWC